MSERPSAERLWFGTSLPEQLARIALAPLSGLYRVGAAARGAMYDAGMLPVHDGPIAAVSVGNLTVGGTGKTPVAAWLAGTLAARGVRAAIVLRGYGDDEPLVHRLLNPAIPVIVTPDRVAGIASAQAAGADLAVLDDAFQHRRAARAADIVLVSADRWTGRSLMLPAGPFREPLAALRRATLVAITAKAASAAAVARTRRAVNDAAPGVPVAVMRLRLAELCAADTVPRRALDTLRGSAVCAISAVGDPGAFAAQLAETGARVRSHAFADHHAFTATDAARIAATLAPGELPICTLKDYVKLAALWPRQASALWYVSQRLTVEENGGAVDALLDSLLRARTTHSDATAAGPTSSSRS